MSRKKHIFGLSVRRAWWFKGRRPLTLDVWAKSEVSDYYKAASEDILRTTFTLELRMDVADDEQRAVINEALRQAAQLLFAQAAMLAGKRPPQIAVRSENSFSGTQELKLHEDDNSQE